MLLARVYTRGYFLRQGSHVGGLHKPVFFFSSTALRFSQASTGLDSGCVLWLGLTRKPQHGDVLGEQSNLI